MTTDSYVQGVYSAFYGLLPLASQDRVRYAYGFWLDSQISTADFLAECLAVVDACRILD